MCLYGTEREGKASGFQQQRAGSFGQLTALPPRTAVPSLTPARLGAVGQLGQSLRVHSFIKPDMAPKTRAMAGMGKK